VAIAIHNIPEGISVSVPVYYATGDRKKAFLYSFMSGVTEPLGALIGYVILRPFLNGAVFGFVFAAVAGIMALRSGYRAARFFVLASMATLVGAFVTALAAQGYHIDMKDLISRLDRAFEMLKELPL